MVKEDVLRKLGIPRFIGEMTIEQVDAYLEAQQVNFRKLHPHADRERALTGNKYYKLDGQKIYCLDCGQRLGAISYPCPICNEYTDYVTERMLNNPADKGWQDSRFRKKVISDQQQIALRALRERQLNLDGADNLI